MVASKENHKALAGTSQSKVMFPISIPKKVLQGLITRAILMALFFCLIKPVPTFASVVIKINNDNLYTTSTRVTLNISPQDISNAGNISQMSFSNNNSSWSTPEPFSPNKIWNLSLLGDVTDNSKLDIGDAMFIAQYLAGKRQFNPGQLSLADVNQNGKLDIGDAMFIAQYLSGKRTSLPVNKTQKTVYAKFKDIAGNWSDIYSDSIILDASLPKIISITPADASIFYEGEDVLISSIVYEPELSPLEYQFSIDGAIKQDWSAKSNFSWNAAFGRHNLKAQIKDAGGESVKEVEIYVLRKPLSPTD